MARPCSPEPDRLLAEVDAWLDARGAEPAGLAWLGRAGKGYALLQPNGRVHEPFSFALHELARGSRAPASLRLYFSAFTALLSPLADLDAGAGLDRLMRDVAGARRAVAKALALHGCVLRPGRHDDGGCRVLPPRPAALDAGEPDKAVLSAKRIELALVLLSDVYAVLTFHGFWPHANPMKVDFAARLAWLEAHTPRSPWSSPFARYAGNQFAIDTREAVWKPVGFDLHGPVILEAAEGFPPGVRLATKVLVEAGCRISEVLALDLDDWMVADQPNVLAAQNKGSRGARVKQLVLSPELAEEIRAYVARPRAAASGTSLAAIMRWRRAARRCFSPRAATGFQPPITATPILPRRCARAGLPG